MKTIALAICTFLLLVSSGFSQESRHFSKPTTANPGPRYYGWPLNGSPVRYHVGIDYIGTLNSAITAVGSGRVVTVIKAGPGDRGLGNTIIVQHAMPSPTFSLYGHLSSIDPQVAIGKYVTKGQLLGGMGSTGSGSNGIVHLHFEMKTLNSLGNNENTVGYSTKSPSTVGYLNPSDYFGVKQYSDFNVTASNPSQARVGAGIIAKPTIENPFGQASVLDMRLQVLNSAGTWLKDLDTKYGVTMNYSGSMGFTFSTAAHGLAAGSYRLQLVYKSASSTKWFVLPYGTAWNPWPITVIK